MRKKNIKNHRLPWTKDELKALQAHSKARTPMQQLVKEFGRTSAALRAQAELLGIGLGHLQQIRP
jgi:hypothetical protein